MKLAQAVALVGMGVLLGGFVTTRSEAQQVGAQISYTPSGVCTGRRAYFQLRPVTGFGNQDCTVVRVTNLFVQCKERPLDWWNTQRIRGGDPEMIPRTSGMKTPGR